MTCISRCLANPNHGPLTRYVKIAAAYAPGMPGTFSPPPRVSDPDMRHARAVMHVETANKQFSLKSVARGGGGGGGGTFPPFPAHAQPAILRIRQEAHDEANYMPSINQVNRIVYKNLCRLVFYAWMQSAPKRLNVFFS